MSTNNSSCNAFEQYEDTAYLVVVGLRGAAGGISALCCLAVVLLIILMKKYQFFAQRLILYLTLSTMAYSLVCVFNVGGLKASTTPSLKGYCVFAGFLEQLTSWWVPLAIACIVIDLFSKVLLERTTERLEYVYLFIIFASPLLFSWIPFIQLAYGQAGAWCWIRDHDYDTCEKFPFGTALRFVIFWVPVVILMVILTVMLVAIVLVLKRKQKRWYGNYDPETEQLKKRMHREVFPLISYPIIYLVLNIFPIANRIVDIVRVESVIVLVLLAGVSLPIQGLVLTIAFVADRETRSLLTPRHLIGMIMNTASSSHRQLIEDYPIAKGEDSKEREIEQSTRYLSDDQAAID